MTRQHWKSLIEDELVARRDDEGCSERDLEEIRARFAAIQAGASPYELEYLYEELVRIQPRNPQPYEPSNLAAIQAARPEGPRRLSFTLTDEQLFDKIYGGWLGRAAGCALGKPVECWSRAEIEAYLREFGEEDVTDFIPYRPSPPGEENRIRSHRIGACRGQIKHMLRDDDMDYPVLGLDILTSIGPEFTTMDVGRAWLQKLAYFQVYTAERVAYRNLIEGRTPPETAFRYNPYRQWIGAQIRGDIFGWVNPGEPERAAALAFKDAALSHVKNGIYGEMWVAAALAAAFTTNDIDEVIRIATSEIPQESRFTKMVHSMLRWRKECPDWKSCWDRINAEYGSLHAVHTLNNAALVILGLLYGEYDFGRTISIAVQGGWDTDCNGATAGSILGVILGARALPKHWVGQFNDTLVTAVFGYSNPTFTSLAERTLGVAKSLRA